MQIIRLISTNWFIIVILVITSVLRFWRLEALTTFGGDQGYDFLVVKRMVLDGNLTLLGPKIGPYNNLGDVFLGPAYYYILAPALLLFKFDPLGAAVLSVAFSVLTVLLIYYTCRKFLNNYIAFWAAAIYALNPFLIDQSRAPSNPHLIPFFSILAIFCCLNIITARKTWPWQAVLGLALGIMFQLHYLTLSLILVLLAFLFFTKRKSLFLTVTFYLFAISPQILFELRHNFFVSNQIIKQLKFGETIASSQSFYNHFRESIDLVINLFVPQAATSWIIPLIIVFLFLSYSKNRGFRPVILITAMTLASAIIFASLYQKQVLQHYLASSYPSITIILGVVIFKLTSLNRNIFTKTILFILIAQVLTSGVLNLRLNRQEGYTMPKGWNLTGIKKSTNIIASDVKIGDRFNVAATLDGDTRAMPYRYLLEIKGKPPLGVENYPESDVLYLISADDVETIKRYTVWEVSSYSPFKVSDEWTIQNGIKLYKLIKAPKTQT